MEYKKNVSMGMIITPCILILWALLFGVTTSDIEQDKARCADKLVGAATCIPYVSDAANVPPKDCCTGFNQIVENTPECICLLVKDKDDPSLGLKINTTRALGLPIRCHATVNLTVGDCPALLHLAPNSPDAKVFKDLENIGNSTTNATAAGSRVRPNTTNSPSNNTASDGGKRKSCLGSEMVSWVLLSMLAFIIFPNLCCSASMF